MSELLKTKIDGVSENEAVAIEWVIEEVAKTADQSKAMLSKIEKEYDKVSKELNLLYQVESFVKKFDETSTLYRDVQDKIKEHEKFIEQLETYKKPQLLHIKMVEETLAKIKNHIETKKTNENSQVIAYDKTYFEAFMDLAFVLFQVPQDEAKKE